MSDDNAMHGPSDRTRISIDNEDDIHYWTREFACSSTALRAAVQSAGAAVGDVQTWLGRGRYRARSSVSSPLASHGSRSSAASGLRAGCDGGDR
jgi:hypothetical protein